MHCSNCGAQLSCGCQIRTASNGVRVCTTCAGTYEARLNAERLTQENNLPTQQPENGNDTTSQYDINMK